MNQLLLALGLLWASPYTVLGGVIDLVGLCTGGQMQRRGRVLEFYGGAVTWLVTHLPTGPYTLAFTLGHTVLGRSSAALDVSRPHELVHVRQFERWGPMMGPAYLLASLYQWIIGRRPGSGTPPRSTARYDEAGEE